MAEKKIYDIPSYSELTATPAIPPTGFWKIYPKGTGWYALDSAGVETLLGGTGAGHIIADEGTPLPTQPTLNFVGAGVTVTDGVGETIVTIPGGGGLATADNGLNVLLSNVQLGGPLLTDTNIDGASLYNFTATNLTSVTLGSVDPLGQARLQHVTATTNAYITLNAGFTDIYFVDTAGLQSSSIELQGAYHRTTHTYVSGPDLWVNILEQTNDVSYLGFYNNTTGATNSIQFSRTGQAIHSSVNTANQNGGINENRFIVRDDAFEKGLVAYKDYSAKFTPESYVTKRYVDALSFGSVALSSVLGVGNTTGANNISIDAGQAIEYNEGLGGFLVSNATTGTAKYWYLPDAEGTIALTNGGQVFTDASWQATIGKFIVNRTGRPAGNYTLQLSDVYVGATAITFGGDTYTLPSVASAAIGQIIVVADESGTADVTQPIFIQAQVGELIDGVSVVELTAPYGSGTFFNTGTMWKILN